MYYQKTLDKYRIKYGSFFHKLHEAIMFSDMEENQFKKTYVYGVLMSDTKYATEHLTVDVIKYFVENRKFKDILIGVGVTTVLKLKLVEKELQPYLLKKEIEKELPINDLPKQKKLKI